MEPNKIDTKLQLKKEKFSLEDSEWHADFLNKHNSCWAPVDRPERPSHINVSNIH